MNGRTVELKDIHFRVPLPLKHMIPHGRLPNTVEAAALWQFLIGAFQALDRIPKQTTYIGDTDATADLMQIAESSRKMYELPDLEGMFNNELIKEARAECFVCGLPWNPQINAFFDSGGKSYRLVDRDPDKVGH
jgi:hypothetical protein